LKVISTSLRRSRSALPERSRNGTPDHRQLSISTINSASVSVFRAGSTPGSAV
jgi:hypothetical protein